jgi:hypothetical protein
MKEEDHLKAYQEYKDNIFLWALEIRGLEKSQRTVALNASRAMVELENKEGILKKMVALENTSEILAYGAPKPKENIKEIIVIFNEIERILRSMMNE